MAPPHPQFVLLLYKLLIWLPLDTGKSKSNTQSPFLHIWAVNIFHTVQVVTHTGTLLGLQNEPFAAFHSCTLWKTTSTDTNCLSLIIHHSKHKALIRFCLRFPANRYFIVPSFRTVRIILHSAYCQSNDTRRKKQKPPPGNQPSWNLSVHKLYCHIQVFLCFDFLIS